ncbi:Putative binding domain-containing protein, N-terminal [Zunongwangia mangrovi]|uniref:Putative binding domain-containing protein, N-terminal n=1 Tax=Zunongwangia mangrovi TaxID=1334022 RepID=A0A1I1DC94_9FLAO|nr:BACON domain-containing protein [Zunongwangia mangrovi]SFB72457.1 Putative binding domain-containing protein, N-terminal [Zunongwangia mangrovi]
MGVGKVVDRVGWGNSNTEIPESLLQDIEKLKNAQKKTIDLGNINALAIEKAFNNKALENYQAYGTSFEIPATGYVQVTATQNEKEVVWLFTGAAGSYNGNTKLATAGDFTRISFDGQVDLEAIRSALGDSPVLAGGNTSDTAQTLREDTDTSLEGDDLQFSTKAKKINIKRFKSKFKPTPFFNDDFTDLVNNKDEFLDNPTEGRYSYPSVMAGGTKDTSKLRNIFHAALYASLTNDQSVANAVAEEFVIRLLANDLQDPGTFEHPVGTIEWIGGAYFHFATNIKKMHKAFELIYNIQNVWTNKNISDIKNYFKDFNTILWNYYERKIPAVLGVDWKEGNFAIPSYLTTTLHYPIENSDGTPNIDFVVTNFQEAIFNNRMFDIVGYIHHWAVNNNDTPKEVAMRNHVKMWCKYAMFTDGTLYEIYRNSSDDRNKGVFYSNITLCHVIDIAHLDAMANHFPGDRLYDYETTEGIEQGSINLTNIIYTGSSTTDGVTPKNIKKAILNVSKYLRSSANGGFNDLRYFEGVPLDSSQRNVENNTFPRYNSIVPAIANYYYNDPELEDYYLYNTDAGYPQKQIVSEGIVKVEDWGANEIFIIGNLWIQHEFNIFDPKYFGKKNISAYQAKLEPISNLLSRNSQDALKEINEKTEDLKANTTGYKSQVFFIDETGREVSFNRNSFLELLTVFFNQDNDLFYSALTGKGFKARSNYPSLRLTNNSGPGNAITGDWTWQTHPSGYFLLINSLTNEPVMYIHKSMSEGSIVFNNDRLGMGVGNAPLEQIHIAENIKANIGKFQSLEVPGYQKTEIIDVPNAATYVLNRNSKISALHLKEGTTDQSFSINKNSLEDHDVTHYKVMRGRVAGKLTLDNSGEAIPQCQILTPKGKSNQVIQGGVVDIYFFSSVLSNGTWYYYWLASGDLQDIFISDTSKTINAGGGSFELTIATLYEWSVDDNSDWISFSKTSGVGSDKITVTIDANATPEIGRVANIEISDGHVSETLQIQQNAQ